MENKYYQEQQLAIEKHMQAEEFEKASKMINEELTMPYIPREFEKFLIDSLGQIPLSSRTDSYSLTLDRITDLLIKLDKSKNDTSDLIKYMSKFNLENEKEELEYYFSKTTNKRNRAMVFELLINMKVDIECDMGRTSQAISIKEMPEYKTDLEVIQNKLEKYPTFSEITIDLLDEVYLTKHAGQVLDGDYADMVIFTTAQILSQDEIINLVDDLEKVKEKLEAFKSFDNLQ